MKTISFLHTCLIKYCHHTFASCKNLTWLIYYLYLHVYRIFLQGVKNLCCIHSPHISRKLCIIIHFQYKRQLLSSPQSTFQENLCFVSCLMERSRIAVFSIEYFEENANGRLKMFCCPLRPYYYFLFEIREWAVSVGDNCCSDNTSTCVIKGAKCTQVLSIQQTRASF